MMKERFRDRPVRLKGGDWLMLMFLFLVATFPVHLPLQASEPNPPYQVEYVKDSLTINAENIALGSLLRIIREKTGIEFVLGREESERLISIRLGPLPLAECLRRILNHFNHTFLFGPNNKLIKVVILGYGRSDSSHQLPVSKGNPLEVPGSQSAQVMTFTPSIEGMVIKPSTGAGIVVTSSSDTMVVETPTGEGMIMSVYTGESKSEAR
jgi:hypothetical protein